MHGVHDRARDDPGFLAQLGLGQRERVDRLLLPRPLRQLQVAVVDRIAVLLDQMHLAIVDRGDDGEIRFSTTPYRPLLPSARTTSSSRTVIQRLR